MGQATKTKWVPYGPIEQLTDAVDCMDVDGCPAEAGFVSMGDEDRVTRGNGDSIIIGDTGASIIFVNSTKGLVDYFAVQIPISGIKKDAQPG